MPDSKQTIKACPACGFTHPQLLSWYYASGPSHWQCNKCYLHGPQADNEKSATAKWNDLPRREDFYGELMGCLTKYDEYRDGTDKAVIELAQKYAPDRDGTTEGKLDV